MFERKTLKQHNTAALENHLITRGGGGGGGKDVENDFRATIFPAIFELNLGSKPCQAAMS